MPSFAGLGKFFGRTASEGAAFAAGVAVAPALSPVVREIVNEANSKYATHPLSPGDAAAIVAEDVEAYDFGAAEASFNGVNDTRFRALLGEVLNAPGVAELLVMWRRGKITDTDFTHGLRKAKLETRWDVGLEELKNARLSPQELAVMAQRSVVPNDGLLPVTFDNAGSNVTPMPMANIDTLAEAEAAGYGFERLAALARIVGLPPAPGELLQLLNRGKINEAAFRQGISEGNTRNEWADVLLTLRRRLLSPAEYAELDLRGWISHAERDAGAALSGMEPTDTDLLFKLHGRPITVHQITTGLARGGTFDAGSAGIPPEYLRALEQGSERPEWYSLSYANRYNLPSPFVMRQLTQSGVWDETKAAERLKWAGWFPQDADEAAKAWATAKAGSAKEATAADLLALYDGRRATEPETLTALEALGYPADEAQAKVDVLDARRVSSARGTVISDLHTAFKKGNVTPAAATVALGQLDVPAAPAAQIIAYWQVFLDAETASAPPPAAPAA